MLRKRNIIAMVLLMTCTLMLTACGELVNEYCSYPGKINLSDAEVTQLTPLYAATHGVNTFCRLYCNSQEASAYTVTAVSADGNIEKTAKVSKERTPCVLGVDTPSGFIIGNSSMKTDNPYIFDRVCPNCYVNGKDLTGKVQFDASGITATCTKCKRKYDLLNGGLVVAGENGQKLFRYYGGVNGNSFYVTNPR